MPFARRVSRRIGVRARLTLAFFGIIGLSWALSGVVTYQYFRSHYVLVSRQSSPSALPPGLGDGNPGGPIRWVHPMDRPPDLPTRSDSGRAPAPAYPGVGLPPLIHSLFRVRALITMRSRLRGSVLWREFHTLFPVQALIAAALSLGAGWWLSRGFTRRLALLAAGAHAFHDRQFEHRVPVVGNDEFAEVAATMNEMAVEVGAQVAALEEDARRRRQMLADVAHELRSPVATLEAMALALRDGVADDPGRRNEALAFLIDSSARMRRLVNDLLEVARLDLHEIPLVRAPLDLREVAEETVYTHRRSAEDAGLRLIYDDPGRPVTVEADRLRLGQVLDNLVENAVAYAGRGAEIRIRVAEDPPGIGVEDNGVGIAAKHLPFLFDPFYRADGARTPGTNHSGLGLRIARGLVEAQGGTLTLESEEGRGTRVPLVLPAWTGDAPRDRDAGESKPG